VLAYTVLFFGTRAFCHTGEDARRLLLAPVIGMCVASAYAVVQVARLDPIQWRRVAEVGSYVRPFATMGHPNFLGGFLVMTVPLALAVNRRAVRWAAWAAVIVIVLTLSRGAWLALIAALLV